MKIRISRLVFCVCSFLIFAVLSACGPITNETPAAASSAPALLVVPSPTSSPSTPPIRTSPTPADSPAPTPLTLPLPLAAEKQEFRDDILVVGMVADQLWEYEGKFQIFIGKGKKDGKWMDAVDFIYKGKTGEEYIYYLDDKGYGEYPEPDEYDFYDVTDYYFESELLHRDMTFYVYDGKDFVGTGHIADTPYFVTYYLEASLWAGFQMDDPSIILDAEKRYSVSNANFCSSKFYPQWNEKHDRFSMNIGHDLIIRGRIYELPYEKSPDQKYGMVDIDWRGKTYSYDIGNTGSFLDIMSPYSDRISFADLDGDGLKEMLVFEDYAGGWNQAIVSFAGDKPETLLYQGGRY